VTATILNILDQLGSCHLTIANELRQVREVQHDAGRSVLALCEDCCAPIVGKEDIVLCVLRTKMVPGDLENVELGGGQRAAHILSGGDVLPNGSRLSCGAELK
jgi:hypothetical protein